MLPTNPQSMSTAEKSILENLREQGAQIDRQARVMEKLVDRIARMMTAEERVEKKTKKNDREIKGDTKIKDVPGLLIDKLADKLDDSITKQFLKIKDSFKKEKQEPIDRSQEPALTEKEKEKKPKDDTLKAILNSMIGNSKYQEQMTENSKALQSIADKTLTNVDNLNDNLKNIEQPEANTTEKENKTEEKNNKKEGKLNNNQKLAIAIGASIAAALKPQFDTLGKTLKEALEQGFANLASSIDNMSGKGGMDGLIPLDGPDGKGSKDGKNPPGRVPKGNPPRVGGGPGGIVAAISAAILIPEISDRLSNLTKPTVGNQHIIDKGNEEKKAKEEEKLANLKKRSADGRLKLVPEIGTDGQLTPDQIKKRDAKNKDGTNTDIDKDGKVVKPEAPAPVMRLDNILPAESKENQKSKAGNKPLDVQALTDVLGIDVGPNESRMTGINPHLTFSDDPNSQVKEQKNATDKMSNDSKAAAKAAAKRREENERLKAAESIDPKALEWAKKRYNDPNMSDPGYLSQEKNKSILEWLQQKKHQDHIKQNPNYNLEIPKDTTKKESEIKPKPSERVGLLNEVTNEKVALTDSKKEQPIVITNNNTNTGGGSDPAPIAFGSASPRNTSTSINDYFRNNGKLHDATYG